MVCKRTTTHANALCQMLARSATGRALQVSLTSAGQGGALPAPRLHPNAQVAPPASVAGRPTEVFHILQLTINDAELAHWARSGLIKFNSGMIPRHYALKAPLDLHGRGLSLMSVRLSCEVVTEDVNLTATRRSVVQRLEHEQQAACGLEALQNLLP